MFRRAVNNTSGKSWRDMRHELEELDNLWLEKRERMTQIERELFTEERAELQKAYGEKIRQGALQEFEERLAAYLKTFDMIRAARQVEEHAWNVKELHEALNYYDQALERILTTRGGFAGDEERLEHARELYESAQISGDKYRQRAAAEIFSNLAERVPAMRVELKLEALDVGRSARKDYAKTRYFQPVEDAKSACRARFTDVYEISAELARTADILGEGYGALRKASLRVKSDGLILNADDPEITGVMIHGEKAESALE